MDLSAVIFVALAIAWAAYLVPKALKHHDEVRSSRPVPTFSSSMRVLARRDSLDGRQATLVVPGSGVTAVRPEPTPAQLRARRASHRRAVTRRRNVLGVLVLANVLATTFAATGLASWWWQALPGVLLVAWLVACRVMVLGEERAWDPVPVPLADDEDDDATQTHLPVITVTVNDQGFSELAPESETATIDAVPSAAVQPGLWEMVPVTLPTYVDKPAAVRRSVRTIDLDSTGVWTSGRTEVDARIAREAEAAEATAKAAAKASSDDADGTGRAAVGS